MSTRFATLVSCFAITSIAVATDGPQLQPAPPGVPVRPIAVAGISPDRQLTTPWIPIGDGAIGSLCTDLLCFDNFEPVRVAMPAGPAETYCPDCGLAGSRWFFGPGGIDGVYTCNDMLLGCSNCHGSISERIEFAWYWGPCPIAGGSQNCMVAVFTTEDWIDCTWPGSGSTYSGVIYNFGTLPCNTGSFYYADLDLCTTGLFHQLPVDGAGGYCMVLSQGFSAGGALLLAEGGQPMLWGTKNPSNPDSQNNDVWVDDNPRDSSLNPTECYNFGFGLCPDPLGPMIGFYGNTSQNGHYSGSAVCTPTLCPPAGTPTTKIYKVTGNANNINWSWRIESATGVFTDIVDNNTPGSTTTCGIATNFRNSINAAGAVNGCASNQLISGRICIFGLRLLLIKAGAPFTLYVGPAGGPACCPVVFTLPACSFNPDIEEIQLPGNDCNGNSEDDWVDIAFGTSLDVNENGIPDECESFSPCDTNCDGAFDGFDIDSFVELLTGSGSPCHPGAGDINGDGLINGFDVDAFVAALSGGGC